MLKWATITMLALALSACSAERAPTPTMPTPRPDLPTTTITPTFVPQPTPTIDEQAAIYNAAISWARDEYGYYTDNPLLIVNTTLAASTDIPRMIPLELESELSAYEKTRLPGLTQETWQAFIAANEHTQPLPADLNLTRNHVFISREEVATFSEREGRLIGPLSTPYPEHGGYMALSAIGYNPSAGQAVVSMAAACGAECGQGDLYLLSNEEDRWVVKGVERLWNS